MIEKTVPVSAVASVKYALSPSYCSRGRSSLAATMRPLASSRKIEPAPISSRNVASRSSAPEYVPMRSARIRTGSRESSRGTTECRCIELWIEPP